MANYETLKSAIQQVVKTNGNNEITGALLQQSLLAMINSLGVGYQYMGIATPDTNPGTLDQKVFYLAIEGGTYVNFNSISVSGTEISILKYDTEWRKDVLPIIRQDAAQLYKNNDSNQIGYIDNNGTFVALESTMHATDYISLGNVDIIRLVNVYSNKYGVAAYVFYDENKNFVSRSPISTEADTYTTIDIVRADIPETAKYIRVTTRSREYEIKLVYILSRLLNDLFVMLDDIIKRQKITNETTPTEYGYITRTGDFTSLSESGGLIASDYIEIPQYQSTIIVARIFANQYGVAAYAFYDENKTFISCNPNVSVSTKISGELTPPENAKYIRVSALTADNAKVNISVYLIDEFIAFRDIVNKEFENNNKVFFGLNETGKADLAGINNNGYIDSTLTPKSGSLWKYGIIKIPYGAKKIRFKSIPTASYSTSVFAYWFDVENNVLDSFPGSNYMTGTVVTMNVPVGAFGLMLTASRSTLADYDIEFDESGFGLIADVAKNTKDIEDIKEIANPGIEILIPDIIYAIVGTELNIWNDAVSLSVDNGLYSPRNYVVEWICNKGMVTARSFRYNPVVGDIGNVSCTCIISNSQSHSRIAIKTFTIKVVGKNALQVSKKIVHFGDSLGASAANALYQNFNNSDKYSGVIPTMLGTRGTTPHYEAVGGYKWESYATQGGAQYRINVTNVGSINIGSVYNYNGTQYTIREVNITGGSGNLLLEAAYGAAGNIEGVTSGTITFVSGSGDAQIAFTNSVREPNNPLWDSTLGGLSVAKYKERLGLSSTDKIDAATFQFGVNESTGTPNLTNILNQYIIPLYNAFIADNPDCKFIIGLTTSAGNDVNGSGANYGASFDTWNYLKNTYEFRKMYLGLQGLADYPNIIIAPSNLWVDRYYGYARSTRPISQRTSQTEEYHNNFVHPGTDGYGQLGDCLFATYVGVLSE